MCYGIDKTYQLYKFLTVLVMLDCTAKSLMVFRRVLDIALGQSSRETDSEISGLPCGLRTRGVSSTATGVRGM